ncbi:hypothetical protein BIW11_05579, partial [Tropilaelaps mercedesae]
MSNQEKVTVSRAGDCGWHFKDSRNGRNLSTPEYGHIKDWTNVDSNSTPAMSKTVVANLLRQMKGFVSSNATIEQNQPDEHWGVGEGPIIKGWGQLPQQQQQSAQQQADVQHKSTNRDRMSSNKQMQIFAQRRSHVVALNKKKAALGWCSNSPLVKGHGDACEILPTSQYSWVFPKTDGAYITAATVNLANCCAINSLSRLRASDVLSHSASPKIS